MATTSLLCFHWLGVYKCISILLKDETLLTQDVCKPHERTCCHVRVDAHLSENR